MISLKEVIALVGETRGEEMPFVYSSLTIQEWTRKGVISRVKVNNGNVFYPDIVSAEILTAFELKTNYSLKEIAEARNYLELEDKKMGEITEKNLIKFINCSKLFNDKKLVIKQNLNDVDSLDKVKKIIDDLLQERKRLEVVEAYINEFIAAVKEIKDVKNRKAKNYA